MKQLLHSSTDGCHVVVALYDTVYYYGYRRRTLSDNIPGGGEQHQHLTSTVVHELAIDTGTGSKSSEFKYGTDNIETVITPNNAAKKSTSSTVAPELTDPHEVQAVAVTVVDAFVWCAVARYDKSLTLYRIPHLIERAIDTSTTSNNTTSTTTTTNNTNTIDIATPNTIHRTAKRISSLSFATVYGATSDDPNLTVIVAGDVVGDANAYSLLTLERHDGLTASQPRAEPELPNDGPDKEEEKDDEEDIQQQDQIITKHRRLLLGHTASMLTSVHIVKRYPKPSSDTACHDEQRKQQLILTSDRDEKIRVSRFPESFCIEGFLLGHTAFVSSVAPLPTSSLILGKNICVSVGGDCTIRLWDYVTCKELAMTSTNLVSTNPDTIAVNEVDKSTATDSNVAPMEDINETIKEGTDENTTGTPTGPIPTKVAVSTDGSVIATIYDDCCCVDLWAAVPCPSDGGSEKSTLALNRMYRWDCPGQPLGITFLDNEHFLLVMQEPHYLKHFQIIRNAAAGSTSTTDERITDIVAIDNDACGYIQRMASQRDIIMLDGLLEKDEYGCLKMGKMSERRGGATIQPWNNFARKETNAERIRRLRKRRRDEQIQKRQQQQQQEEQQNES
jgi:tRNA (guanine-N(7)-)-methyltransferase subunit TRM82